MKFTNDPGAITRLFETADQIGGILVVESEFPGRQPDLPVLMRIKPCQQRRPRLTTPRLRNVGSLKQDSVGGKLIENWRLYEGLSITPNLWPIILGYNQ